MVRLAHRAESHEQAQTRLLEEMVRVLKPGGFLYLTTKNRFAPRLLSVGRTSTFRPGVRQRLSPRLGAWLMKRRAMRGRWGGSTLTMP